MRISDWSSDVCSSDLEATVAIRQRQSKRERSEQRRNGGRGFGGPCSAPIVAAGFIQQQEQIGARLVRLPAKRKLHHPHRIAPPLSVTHPDHARLIEVEQAGRSEEHTSELQSLMRISYAVF